jgi:putative hydrolase of the HAD superfamily
LVVFDGDDTLWFVEGLYDAARADAGRVVEEAGIDSRTWAALQRRLDIENVARFGLSPERFPTSSVEAYERLSESSGRAPDPSVVESIRALAARVFESAAPVANGAEGVLADLIRTHRLVLLTRGDPAVQRKRLADSGLESFFERVEIVPDKNAAVFRDLLSALAIAPDQSWSIGNSVPSDINPALACGMSAIWVDADVWEYERREVTPSAGRLFIVHSLLEVPNVLRSEVS